MFQEHAQVVLACPLPALGLEPGDVGVVVFVHANGAAYEVQFMSLDGHTIGVETLLADQLRAVSGSAVRTSVSARLPEASGGPRVVFIGIYD